MDLLFHYLHSIGYFECQFLKYFIGWEYNTSPNLKFYDVSTRTLIYPLYCCFVVLWFSKSTYFSEISLKTRQLGTWAAHLGGATKSIIKDIQSVFIIFISRFAKRNMTSGYVIRSVGIGAVSGVLPHHQYKTLMS